MASSTQPWDQFGELYDRPVYKGRVRGFLLASQPRSGSHYLGHLLSASGMLGSPLEYFHPGHLQVWKDRLGVETVEQVFDKLFERRTSSSGWFGVKSHWGDFDAMSAAHPSVIHRLNLEKLIWIKRRDLVDQSVSMVIAQQTGRWISFQPETAFTPQYDFQAISDARSAIESEIGAWENYFIEHAVTPIAVYYEDLARDPALELRKIYAAFGLEPVNAVSDFPLPGKQASSLNRDWKMRYLAENGETPRVRNA
ncbi:MAG TPA: Stf0 family sulfotransferase [Xanthobacteraceae bacterium]|nr:Stf0 family sulfotransferase [Xanthobacteraceae bacterium]